MACLDIVVPVFNRTWELRRALASVVAQDFQDWIAYVVDDGSVVNIEEQLRGFCDDSRIVYVRHRSNMGVGPARNSGIAAGSSPWVVLLDSDDELLPGALYKIRDVASCIDSDIGRIGFSCIDDSGALSPRPLLGCERLESLRSYLRFMEVRFGRGSVDMLYVVRREAANLVAYSSDRSLEDEYHLRFMQRFEMLVCEIVLRRYHQDGEGRLIDIVGNSALRESPEARADRAASLGRVLSSFGESMSRDAPRWRCLIVRRRVALLLLLGERRAAIACSFGAIRTGFNGALLPAVGAALLGSSLTGVVRRLRKRRNKT